MPKNGALLVGLRPKTLALERSHRSPDVSFPFTMATLHEILCHSVSVDGLLVPMRGEYAPQHAYVRVLPRTPSECARGRHAGITLCDGLVSCPHCRHEARRIADETSARGLKRKNSPSTAAPTALPRTISRTGRSDMAALKPMTPLQPLMQATVKPPSPLRTPEQQPLKPTTPLQPQNALKTPISHPQRRRRFQPTHLTGPQRR